VTAFVVGAERPRVLDGSILNIALPSIQDDLGFSRQSLRWVVSGCVLTFGGLTRAKDKIRTALVLLRDQDRSRWDRARIAEGRALLDRRSP
jgi:hypothetical protein